MDHGCLLKYGCKGCTNPLVTIQHHLAAGYDCVLVFDTVEASEILRPVHKASTLCQYTGVQPIPGPEMLHAERSLIKFCEAGPLPTSSKRQKTEERPIDSSFRHSKQTSKQYGKGLAELIVPPIEQGPFRPRDGSSHNRWLGEDHNNSREGVPVNKPVEGDANMQVMSTACLVLAKVRMRHPLDRYGKKWPPWQMISRG